MAGYVRKGLLVYVGGGVGLGAWVYVFQAEGGIRGGGG